MNVTENNSKPVQIDNGNFDSEVLQSRQPVLVAFVTLWSRPCAIISPVLDEIASECADKMKVVRVNADTNLDLSLWYDVQSIPTLLYFVAGNVQRQDRRHGHQRSNSLQIGINPKGILMIALTTFTDSRLAYAVESKRMTRKFARRLSPTVLEIVMLFDDDESRAAGENLCHRVNAQLGPRYAFKLLPWKFSVTQFPMLTDIVAREAMRSPFLLVTVNGAKAVTPEVEAFIRRCASAMQRSHSALVVQLHGIAKAQKESSPAYQCLSRIADDANTPFFSTVVELNQQSRGAGRASPHRSGSPFVAVPPQTLPQNS